MNSLSKQQELINALKTSKTNIMNQQSIVKSKIAQHYSQLRDIVDAAEKEAEVALDREGLKFYQTCANAIRQLTNKNISEEDGVFEQGKELLQCKINDRPAISLQKLQKIIKKSFDISISSRPSQQSTNILKNILEQSQTNTQTHDIGEIVIQKLQCERDYYQRRQLELQHRIKELESGPLKRGVNIKEMSRSYLEEKCSKWALQRLTEQKKILVERIGEASQEILRLNTELGDLQHEIKKMTGTAYDGNSRSMVGNSSIKINSIVEQTRHYQRILESEERREREAELQLKNEQLMLEVTRCMKQMEELSQSNISYESKLQQSDQKIQQLQELLSSAKETNQNLNHDYELSLKRKATFQHELKQLRSQLQKANEGISEQRQAYKTMIAELEHRQEEVVAKVKSIETIKKQDNQRYEQKIRLLLEEKDKVIKMMEEMSVKKGEEINYKALLNDQITRLHKENHSLSQELTTKEQQVFEANVVITNMTNSIKELEVKTDKSKKEVNKLKKQNKQLEKQIGEQQKTIETKENLEIKAAHIEQNYHILISEFNKYKDTAERKYSIQQRTISHLKEKFSFQLSALLNDDSKAKTKKNNPKIEIIEKYIEQMSTLSAKTSQIKQLKQQIRQLKEGKEQKSQSKKGRTDRSLEETVTSLEAGVITLGTNIMNERIKAEKEANEDSVKQLQEILAKDQVMIKTLQEQLQRQKQLVLDLKKSQKKQSLSQDKTKELHQKQEKMERLELQLKISRSNGMKLQNENTELQSQLKTKKELCGALKKDNKEKDDLIRQIKKELAVSQDELQKLKRNQKEVSKKETMFKDYKEKKELVKEQNITLKKTIQTLEDKVKLLTKQLSKKDQTLKQFKLSEEKQLKLKQQGKLKEAYEQISSQKEVIRKLKMQIDRKDEIIKTTKEKAELKVKELEDRTISKEKENEKNKKDIQNYERKIQNTKSSYKKEENKNYVLAVTLKKIYQLCINQAKEEHSRTSNQRQFMQYYTASNVTPHQMKSNTTASQLLRSNDMCEGLRILDLKPQDLEGLFGETTLTIKGNNQNQQENSWSMVSPIVCKSNETMKHQQLISGLQQLEKQLSQKQVNSGSIVQLFKRVLIVQ